MATLIIAVVVALPLIILALVLFLIAWADLRAGR